MLSCSKTAAFTTLTKNEVTSDNRKLNTLIMEQNNNMNIILENRKSNLSQDLPLRELFISYYKAFEKYTPSSEDDEITKMLKRGLFLPINLPQQSNGLLIVGANPSEGEETEDFTKLTETELFADDHNYWKKAADLARVQETEGNGHKGAYLDLFPIKETHLEVFEKVFRKQTDIRAKILQTTHRLIVDLHPKVIVNLFAMTSYYWGFDADKEEYCNTAKPWMGYKFEKIQAEGLDAYKIKGWVHNNDKCILQDDDERRLKTGTVIVFNTKIWNKTERDNKMVTADKLRSLITKNHIILGE